MPGRQRWLDGGMDLLVERGHQAVKLHALVDKVGLTTGSFYHFFDGMADFLAQLAHCYSAEQLDVVLEHAAAADPIERLQRFSAAYRDLGIGPLDAAFRSWAHSCPVAAEAMRLADKTALLFIEQAFVDLGSDTDTARTQAVLLLSVGTAHTALPWPPPTDLAQRAIDIVAHISAPVTTSDGLNAGRP